GARGDHEYKHLVIGWCLYSWSPLAPCAGHRPAPPARTTPVSAVFSVRSPLLRCSVQTASPSSSLPLGAEDDEHDQQAATSSIARRARGAADDGWFERTVPAAID